MPSNEQQESSDADSDVKSNNVPLLFGFSLARMKEFLKARSVTGIGKLQVDKASGQMAKATEFCKKITPSVAARTFLCVENDVIGYELLTKLIQGIEPLEAKLEALRHPQPEREDTRTEKEKRNNAEKDVLREVCSVVCQAMGADCFTAYTRNRRVNRSCLLITGGLLVPEAVHGFLWKNDLPTKRLFESKLLVEIHPFDTLTVGTFRQREKVDAAVSIRIESDALTMVLFLNWRIVSESKTIGEAESTDKKPETIIEIIRGNRPEQLEQLCRNLGIAARYLVGWITSNAIAIHDEMDNSHSVQPRPIIQNIQNAVTKYNPFHYILEAIKSLDVGGSVDIDPRIHEVVTREGSRYIAISNISGYMIEDSAAFIEDDTALFQIPDPASDCQAGESLVARSVAWDVSLLFKRDEPASDLTEKFGRSIQLSHIRRQSTAETSNSQADTPFELTVPVRSSTSGHEAVVSITSISDETKYQEEHLRQVELIIQVYQKLRALVNYQQSIVGKTLAQAIKKSVHFQHIIKHFNKMLLEKFNADLVYLLVYDARHDVFYPMGITASDDLFKLWIRQPHELSTLFGYADAASNSEMKVIQDYLDRIVNRPSSNDSLTKSIIHKLLEQVIATRLRPTRASTRSKGITWKVLIENKPHCIPQVSGADYDDGAIYYTKLLFGHPLSTDADSRADGVFWIGWSDPEKAKKHIANTDGKGWQVKDDSMQAEIRQATEAIAAIFALFLYCTPDRAHNPYPFIPEDNRKR